MSRCEKKLPLLNLEAKLQLTASVITPLKFRKLYLQTEFNTAQKASETRVVANTALALLGKGLLKR